MTINLINFPMKRIRSLSIAVFCLYNGLFAQTETKTEAPPSYVSAVKKLNLKLNPDTYYKRGLNINKVAELKTAGFDVYEYDKSDASVHSYKDGAIFTDVIVTGTIISKEYDANKTSLFHSFHKMKVESTLKGIPLPQSTITICLTSGMIGDRAYVNNSAESELLVGEKVLLFLTDIPFDMLENARKKGTFNDVINVDRKDANTHFVLSKKYTIHSTYI